MLKIQLNKIVGGNFSFCNPEVEPLTFIDRVILLVNMTLKDLGTFLKE